MELDRQARYLTEAAASSTCRMTNSAARCTARPRRRRSRPDIGRPGARNPPSPSDASLRMRCSISAMPNCQGTNPQKHSTPFDDLTGQPVSRDSGGVVARASGVRLRDRRGFQRLCADHNDKFCQPLTGDYDRDLAGNRTKRIYADRVGQQVGRHPSSESCRSTAVTRAS